MPPVNGAILRGVSVCRSVQAQNLLNVLHFKVVAVSDLGASYQEICSEVSATWGPLIKQLLPATTTYQGLRLNGISPGPTQIVASTNGEGEGSLAGTPLPDNVSLLVSLRNPDAPVHIRGRLYLPAGDEATNDDTGRPETTYKSTVHNALQTWFSTPIVVEGTEGDTTVRPGLYAPAAIPDFYYVESILVRSQWTSQRRRRPISRPDQPLF